ncbi:MAG: recombinase RecA, partial [Culicoidibacterales bacterium]
GGMYSADTVIVIGRQQDKDGKELMGYNFMLKAEKSRYIREGSVLPLNVSFEGGINTFSGLLEIGLELGFVIKPKVGWYQRAFLNTETGEFETSEDERLWRAADTECIEFWKDIMQHEPWKQAVENRYKLKALSTSDAAYEEMAELFGD